VRGRPPNIRAEDILDAARDEFRQHGHAATTAQIARRAGVSEGILFYRYKTKEALLAAVIHRETEPPERLRELVREAGRRSLEVNVAFLVETVLDLTFRAHPLIELAVTSACSTAVRDALRARGGTPPPEETVRLVAAFFSAEMRIGRARALDPVPLARAVVGGSVDFVLSREFTGALGDRASFVTGLVDCVMAALRPSASRDD
jgi:AcrR family transcriptional regulator